MDDLRDLFANNRAWAAARRAADPAFFQRLCGLQSPRYLWIGCADSRVPANEIVGLAPGELFVHRNVGNVLPPADANALAVLQYAVDVLKVEHVIVCGHYGCGGVRAALDDARTEPPLEDWIEHLRRVRRAHAPELARLASDEERWRRLCELNVEAQVQTARETAVARRAWARGQRLAVHGWIYDLHDGELRDLALSHHGPGPASPRGGRAVRERT
ncbi:MAG: carbonic anhydrase [Vicinamibacterales bacterium]